MSDRISQIRDLLAKTPDDVFLHYSLGMEFSGRQRWDEALAEFAACQRLDPDDVPSRVEQAKVLRAAGRTTDARNAFQEALRVAVEAGDTHRQDFIRQQLESLPE
jgi:uncharacterized protein HemY